MDTWHGVRPIKSSPRYGALAILVTLVGLSWPGLASDIPPRRLLEVVDFGPPTISPDGRLVAFRTEQASVERNTWDTVWYVQDLAAGGHPRRVADGGVTLRDSAGVTVPVRAVWSPDGRWIFYLAAMDGTIDVWRAAADGSRAEPVTRDMADVREFFLDEGGGSLLYRTGASRSAVGQAEQAEYHGGIRIDASVPVGHNLIRSLDLGSGRATQRFDGPWFGLAPLLADRPDSWKRIDLESGGAPLDLPASARPPSALAVDDLSAVVPHLWKIAPEPKGRRIGVLTRPGPSDGLLEPIDVQLSVLADRTGRKMVACEAELCTRKSISNIQWRPGSEEILFTVTDPLAGLAQSMFRWNVRTGQVLPVVAVDGLLGGGRDRFSSCGLSRATLACVVAEADQPPRLERIDLDSGARTVLFDPNAALASDMAVLAPARLMRWEDVTGNVFTGQFFEATAPPDAVPPLFVTYYNCSGFVRGGVGDEWPLASLARRGISALCINAPAGFPLDAVERYGRGTSAVRAVVEKLAAEKKVDRERVGMGGLSFGSEVTFWTLIHSDLLAAASVASPTIEPNYVLFTTLRGDTFFENLYKLWGLRAPDETPDRWQLFSPAYNLARIDAPVLFQLPEQEYLFALGVALPMVRDLQGDLYVFPHEPHQKFQPRHKLAVYERNLDWFGFWLLGEEDASPRKEEQYSHWRRMRDAQESRMSVVGP